jgi:MFS family permease
LTALGRSRAGPIPIYVAKGARVYVSGLLSVMLPAYLTIEGYSPFIVGVALTSILAGNATSNLILTRYESGLGRRRLLLAFSLLMLGSGAMLAFSSSLPLILLACFIGNVSTTGTEAGPFQSVEAGVLPELTGEGGSTRAFGIYNLVGYSASALGAFTLYLPGSLGNSIPVFRGLFLAFGLAGLLLFAVYFRLGGLEPQRDGALATPPEMAKDARSDVAGLSALFSVDAFGGSFVSQYLLSYFFSLAFGVPTTSLAVIFLVTNVISAASAYGSSLLGERIGNLRTMVYTHVISNIFLLLLALSTTLVGALAFLFLRQSLSQMDVPARQALMAEMFSRDDRVKAYGITNTSRSLGTAAGGPVSTVVLASGAVAGLIYLGGVSKLVYDVLIFIRYRKRFR